MKNNMKDEMNEGVDLVKNVEEADSYPPASKQYPNARKYMTYESISTGVGGKKYWPLRSLVSVASVASPTRCVNAK